jgi:hypothetical protein
MNPYTYTAKRYTYSYTTPESGKSFRVRVRVRVRVWRRGSGAVRAAADAMAGLNGSNKPLHWTADYRAVRAGLRFAVSAGGASSGGQ